MNVCFRISRTSMLEVAKVVFLQRTEIVNTWKLWSMRYLGGNRYLYINLMGGQDSCSRRPSQVDGTKSGQMEPSQVLCGARASLVCSVYRPHLGGTPVTLGQISSDWWLSSGRERYYWCSSEEQDIFRNSEIKHFVDFFFTSWYRRPYFASSHRAKLQGSII